MFHSFSRQGVRAHGPVLSLSVALLAIAAACTSSANRSENRLDWGSFVVVSDEDSQYPVDSIEDMERVVGFPFVFPSYLPQGMGNELELAVWKEVRGEIRGVVKKAGPGQRIIVYREDSGAPYITITEQAPPSLMFIQNPISSTMEKRLQSEKPS